MKLIEWIKTNLLPVRTVGWKRFAVEGMDGHFLLIDGRPKDDRVIEAESLTFCVTKLERIALIDDKNLKYILFQFGTRWYYSPIKPFKLSQEQGALWRFKVEFNDFLYLGQQESDVDIVHLGLHTEYELLNSALNLKAAVKKAKFLGQSALGMCDHNTLGGVLAFQLECQTAGIKPVLGMSVTVAHLLDDPNMQPVTYMGKVYALNAEGWQSLLKLTAIINRDKESPWIVEKELLKHGNGLAWVFGYERGQLRDERDAAVYIKTVQRYKKAFSKVFYQCSIVGYTDPDFDLRVLQGMQHYLTNYVKMLPPLLVDDLHYLNPYDAAIKTTINKIGGTIKAESLDQHMRNGDDVFEALVELIDEDKRYSKLEADELVLRIMQSPGELVDTIDFAIPTGQHRLPKFPYSNTQLYRPNGSLQMFDSSNGLFVNLVKQGFVRKVKKLLPEDLWPTYQARMEEELEVIMSAGFADYFLILWDIIDHERKQGGMIGPGRGSVGGSLVAFLMDITEVDPVKYNLLFERFLNKTRVSGERAKMADAMPDVDVDFESARRDEVKAYISRKYGRSYVCSVGSYTRMKLKGALKSLCRVKGMDFKYANNLTADIDNQLEYSFHDLIMYAGKSTPLYTFMQNNPDVVDALKVILNNPSVISVHPSAVIIVPREDPEGNPVDIYNWLPIREVGGLLVSEWEGKYTDRGGFLKEDILGIGQLDKFKYMMKLIRQNTGDIIDLNNIPLEGGRTDSTFALFGKGFNTDVFQFGGYGLKSYSREVEPKCIDDIIAMNALYRPGPMESNAHREFGWIKNEVINQDTGKKWKPKYDFGLEAVTKATSGLYVYQEQIMQAVHVLGGLTLSEADEVRTVMKKFDQKKMATFQEKFMAGAAARGCSTKEAGVIWEKLRAFSKYGFNKSHAAAYGLIAYWCQYLKANYPLEFWATSFNFVDHIDKIPRLVEEIKRNEEKITINPPDVNISELQFTGKANEQGVDGIYWSFLQIKGIGEAVAKAIIRVREQGGIFFDLEDFMGRCKGTKVTKATVRTLILSGAFDNCREYQIKRPAQRRKILIEFYELRKEDPAEDELTHDTELNDKDYYWLNHQRNFIGYADMDFRELMQGSGKVAPEISELYISARALYKKKDLCNDKWGGIPATVCGFLVDIKERMTKNGVMAMLKIESNSETIEAIIWGDVWDDFKTDVEGYLRHMVVFHGVRQWDDYRKGNRMGSHPDKGKTKIIVI